MILNFYRQQYQKVGKEFHNLTADIKHE